jgi:uncharacterized membrane protein YgcG
MYLLFTLGLVVFFYFAVFSKINAAINDTSYQRIFFSRDLALLVDSLHATDGNFSVSYSLYTRNGVWLDADLVSDKVILTDHSEKPVDERAQVSYVFGRSAFVNIIPAIATSRTADYTPGFSVDADNSNITFGNNFKSDSNANFAGKGGRSGGAGASTTW